MTRLMLLFSMADAAINPQLEMLTAMTSGSTAAEEEEEDKFEAMIMAVILRVRFASLFDELYVIVMLLSEKDEHDTLIAAGKTM